MAKSGFSFASGRAQNRIERRSTQRPTTDPLWTSVVSLLNFQGTNGSTTFTDERGHTWTAAGSAQISTAQAIAGASSGLFNGTTSYITAPTDIDWEMRDGDFCYEIWFRCTSVPTSIRCLFERWNNTGVYANIDATGKIYTGVQATTMGTKNLSDTVAVEAGRWHHLALSRDGDTLRAFKDGVMFGSAVGLDPYTIDNLASDVMTIGRDSSVSRYFDGHLAGFRVTKGASRYVADFAPPAYLLPAQ